tara:strand:- start:428 stop:730 length:303 start_codon:yes stop_codon:yes gene_type:complete
MPQEKKEIMSGFSDKIKLFSKRPTHMPNRHLYFFLFPNDLFLAIKPILSMFHRVSQSFCLSGFEDGFCHIKEGMLFVLYHLIFEQHFQKEKLVYGLLYQR